MAAVARPSGAPLPVRALFTLLALGLSALPLWLLIQGLTVRVIEVIRQTPVMVELLPLPEPPPPPPLPVPVEPVRRAANPVAAAPAPASAPPDVPDAPILPTPVAGPPPSMGDGIGTGGSGTGTGSGGTGGGGTGGGAPRAAPVYAAASWVVVPGNPELEPYDPPLAMQRQISGQVLLKCNVLATRRVANCRVAGEQPRGWGFGKAALNASRIFQMNPPMRDGVALEKMWVEIPVAFNHRR